MTSLGIAMASLAKTLWRSTGNCRRLQQLKGPNRLTMYPSLLVHLGSGST